MSTARVRWIDAARGIAMIPIVFGHAAGWSLAKYWVYSFHVPMFFILSGLLYHDQESMKCFVKKKFKQLMIPYYVFGLLSVIVYYLIGSIAIAQTGDSGKDPSLLPNLIGIIYANGKNHMLDANAPLWFLPVLFATNLVSILFDFIRNKVNWIKKMQSHSMV